MSSTKTAAAALTPADYARAERFLSWNKERYVVNADIQHYWIGAKDQFWYLRTNEVGEREFVVVDAASGERITTLDPRRLADALAHSTGKRIDYGTFPFSTLRMATNGNAIEIEFDSFWWRYERETSTLRRLRQSIPPNHVPSPDGKWEALVRNENIWIRSAVDDQTFAATADGVAHYGYGGYPGTCLRSVTDRRKTEPNRPPLMWSPDSRYLLTYRVDERRVRDLFLIQSVPEDGGFRPRLYSYRYPLPGDEHVSLIELVVLDVRRRRRVHLAATPMIATFHPIEMHTVWWSADSRTVYYLERDRFARSISLNKVDVETGTVQEIVRETSGTVALTSATNVFERPAVRTLRNGDVIWYSRRDGWGHLYYYQSAGVLQNQITRGEWVVREIVHIDEPERRIYFTASGREQGRDPYEQRLYSIGLDGSQLQLLTPEEAEHDFSPPSASGGAINSLASEAERQRFSPSGRYFVDSYSRPDMAPTLVLRRSDGQLIQSLEKADISELRTQGYRAIEPFEVLAADGKTLIYGNLFRPSIFDPTRKYPVIDANYPGPQRIRTRKTFMSAVFDEEEVQSIAELGFIVVTIDGRGTPLRSVSFSDHAYGRLDRASDLEDHLTGIRQLAERYPYLDLDRVGIFGISGGGFRAAQAILRYPDFFKVAVASEGNHDQRGNISIWAESYIGPVACNDYSISATLGSAANLSGKLLLMHGELDDNVSPTLTMRLADALIKANKDFDLLILPNENHQTAYKSAYFIRRKWDYFVRHLLGADPPTGYRITQARGQNTR